jgi:hypothetical protein
VLRIKRKQRKNDGQAENIDQNDQENGEEWGALHRRCGPDIILSGKKLS